jgi:hypothetical protein
LILVGRTDGLGFPYLAVATAQALDGLQRLMHRDWQQLERGGPLENPANSVQPEVDDAAAQPGIDDLLPHGSQGHRAEALGNGLTIELFQRPERVLAVLQLAAWRAFRTAVVLLGHRQYCTSTSLTVRSVAVTASARTG